MQCAVVPASANAYDSIGEMLELMEDKAAALESYKKSFALDHKNKNAEERLNFLKVNSRF